MAVTLQSPPLPDPRRRGVTLAEYHAMWDRGEFDDGKRYELIEGDIVATMPPKQPYYSLVRRIFKILVAILGIDYVAEEGPASLPDDTEPQPDIYVTIRSNEEYLAEGVLPPGADLRLAVEVAVTSRSYDLGRKARVYAKAAIPEYWVVDVEKRALVVHRDPSPRGYRTVTVLDESQSVSPLAAPEATLRVADFLPV